jgi:hypothetical protein
MPTCSGDGEVMPEDLQGFVYPDDWFYLSGRLDTECLNDARAILLQWRNPDLAAAFVVELRSVRAQRPGGYAIATALARIAFSEDPATAVGLPGE